MLELFRPKISLMVGLSAFAGACLYDTTLNMNHLLAVFAAVALSAGCSALNQYQEREYDRLMVRTSNRPIPSGRVKAPLALKTAILMLLLSGVFILASGVFYGLWFIPLTVLVYNFIYTPLKRITPYSLLAGSITGSIPPVIGYVLAGGSPFGGDIVAVAVVMYLWQTPHFTLLTDKYSSEYTGAGFKTLSFVYGEQKAMMFVYVWLAGFFCMLFYLPSSSIYCFHISALMHFCVTAFFAAWMLSSFRNKRLSFHILNLCMIIFFLLLVVDRIII